MRIGFKTHKTFRVGARATASLLDDSKGLGSFPRARDDGAGWAVKLYLRFLTQGRPRGRVKALYCSRFRLTRHSDGGTGLGSAHSPRLASQASLPSPV